MRKTQKLATAGILSGLIIVMTVIPYTGYISYGLIEITTLHIPVILGAALLGWGYGGFLGGVWGVTCWIRAFTNPLWVMFTNPLISVVPRILVGIVAGLVMKVLSQTKLHDAISGGLCAAAGTLCNTALVLGAISLFGGMSQSYSTFFQWFQSIFSYIVTINGIIELVAAVIIVPAVYIAVTRDRSARQKG